MATSYKWFRQRTNGSNFILGDTGSPFAAYFSDYLTGVRVYADVPTTPNVVHSWRVRVKPQGSGRPFIETIWEYWTDGTTATYRGGIVQNFIIYWQSFSPPTGTTMTMYSGFEIANSELSESDARTNIAEYEQREGSSVVAGGYGTPGGAIGLGGYDFRTLAIKNMEVEDIITEVNDEESTIIARGDICTLPAPNALFEDGWTPNGNVTYTVAAKNPGGVQTYWSVPGTISPSAPDEDGKIGSFEETWTGKDNNDEGLPVQGLHRMEAMATGNNPVADGGTSSSYRKVVYFLTYICACQVGANVVCAGSACSTSLKPAQGAQSFGYGWSSVASIKVVDSNGKLTYRGANGSRLKWVEDDGDYIPSDPNNYVHAQKDMGSTNARYTLTSRDQSVQEFDTAGKLKRTVDRNGNAVSC